MSLQTLLLLLSVFMSALNAFRRFCLSD